MNQDHHFLPQVYLRQWCVGPTLRRYRCVGPQRRLEERRQSPRTFAYEPGLYAVPAGASANGLTGNGLEDRFALEVDQRLANVVAAVSAFRGHVSDDSVAKEIIWLMRTFQARSPDTIARLEKGASDFLVANAQLIEHMMTRANSPSTRDELRSYLDSRRPAATARAGVDAVVTNDLPADLGWLDGDVYALPADAFRPVLEALGAGEFVTFEHPVVEWDANPHAFVATFAASPDTLVLVVERGHQLTLDACASAVLDHTLRPLPHRESLLCRTPAVGHLRATAERLRVFRRNPETPPR